MRNGQTAAHFGAPGTAPAIAVGHAIELGSANKNDAGGELVLKMSDAATVTGAP